MRYQKYCLRLLAVAIACSAVFILTNAGDPETGQFDAGKAVLLDTLPIGVDDSKELIDFEPLLSRRLQWRLFDPPPPPKKEEVKPPLPPLNVKLLGTMIDPSNRQAIIQDVHGRVSFRSLGQPVGQEFPKSTIDEILPGAIKVRREDQVDTLKVE